LLFERWDSSTIFEIILRNNVKKQKNSLFCFIFSENIELLVNNRNGNTHSMAERYYFDLIRSLKV